MNIIDYFRSFISVINHPFNKKNKFKTIGRVLYWKINQLFFRLPTVIEIEKGIKCICYPDSSYGGMVVYNRWAEYSVMKSIISCLDDTSIYIDVGANIGDTTVIAGAHTKNKIYAFEPSPRAYSRLLENIALNDLGDQIITEQMVVADHVGTIAFRETPTSETSHVSPKGGAEVTTKVRSTTLDAYAAKNKLKHIDLIKIDVEGAEMLVLQGAAQLLTEHRLKNILIELNPQSKQYGYTNHQVASYLKGFGYELPQLPNNLDERILNVHARAPR